MTKGIVGSHKAQGCATKPTWRRYCQKGSRQLWAVLARLSGKAAHEAVFLRLPTVVAESSSCVAQCQGQPQAKTAASHGLQCEPRDGMALAFYSGVLHRSKGAAHQRSHKPPKRPARAEHHRARLRRFLPLLARLERIAAAGPDQSPPQASPRPLRCTQDGRPSTSTERRSPRPALARPAAWC